jgi:hypothetical protein
MLQKQTGNYFAALMLAATHGMDGMHMTRTSTTKTRNCIAATRTKELNQHTQRMMQKATSIEIQLQRLKRELNEALWDNNPNATKIEVAIERLLFLQSMGEQYDVAF